MQATDEPTDPQSHSSSRIRLCFNRRPQPFVEAGCTVASGVRSLAVQVLGCSGSLVELALKLGFGVTDDGTGPFFDLAANILSCAGDTIVVHGGVPFLDGRGRPSHLGATWPYGQCSGLRRRHFV